MMKFFRKYMQQLLVVIVVLLMIVFLGGQALESMLQRSSLGTKVATSRYGDITSADQMHTKLSTEILESAGQQWRTPLGVGEPISEIDWTLLTREAKQFGTWPNQSIIESELTTEDAGNLLEVFAYRHQVKKGRVLQAFQELRAIQDLGRVVTATTIPSVAEVRSIARDALETIDVKAVRLAASMFVDEEAEFSSEEIQAHFEEYRGTEAGGGVEFGYVVPPQVKVQYLKIDVDAIAGNLRVPDSTLVKDARAYYDANRERDPGLRRVDDPADESDAEEESDEEKTPYLSWEEARDYALEAARVQRAEDAAQRMADWIVQQDASEWYAMEAGDSGYKAAPERVAKSSYYQDIVELMPRSIAYPDATAVETTDFFSSQDAQTVEGIGSARATAGGRVQTLSTTAFLVEGLTPIRADDPNRANYLSLNQTYPAALRDFDGNLYVFRVVETDPQHAARSLDEVRDRVIEDLRLKAGYDRALALAQELHDEATSTSLAEAFESSAELEELRNAEDATKLKILDPPAFSKITPSNAAFGRSQERTFVPGGLNWLPNDVVDAIFEFGETNPGGLDVFEARPQAVVLVVEHEATNPPRDVDFEKLKEQLYTQISLIRRSQTVAEWFKPDNIRGRLGLKIAGGDPEDEETEEAS